MFLDCCAVLFIFVELALLKVFPFYFEYEAVVNKH